MVEQLSLSGFELAQPRTDRLFFAIRPDADVAGRIVTLAHTLREKHGLKGSPLDPKRLHITLYFLGDFAGVPTSTVAQAGKVASSLTAAPFELAFDRVMSFVVRDPHPLVLVGGKGLDDLRAFRARLASAMLLGGLKDPTAQKFEPHVTLLYDQRVVAEHPIEPVCWKADELVLVRSLLGQGRHEVIERWPFSA